MLLGKIRHANLVCVCQKNCSSARNTNKNYLLTMYRVCLRLQIACMTMLFFHFPLISNSPPPPIVCLHCLSPAASSVLSVRMLDFHCSYHCKHILWAMFKLKWEKKNLTILNVTAQAYIHPQPQFCLKPHFTQNFFRIWSKVVWLVLNSTISQTIHITEWQCCV